MLLLNMSKLKYVRHIIIFITQMTNMYYEKYAGCLCELNICIVQSVILDGQLAGNRVGLESGNKVGNTEIWMKH